MHPRLPYQDRAVSIDPQHVRAVCVCVMCDVQALPACRGFHPVRAVTSVPSSGVSDLTFGDGACNPPYTQDQQ